MAERVLITMDDIETAVRLNAAFEAAGYVTSMVAPVDDYRAALRRANPELVVLTGGLHESPAGQLAAAAREAEISTFALMESTDHSRVEGDLGVTEAAVKPVETEDALLTARRLIDRRHLQQRTAIAGESPAIQELLVRIEQMAPVSSTVLVQGESGTGKELVAKALHDLSPRRANRSSRSTVPPCRRRFSNPSCSAMKRAPLPVPPSGGWAASSWRMKAPSSWTRSARCRPVSR